MKAELCEEDPNMNMMLKSSTTTGEDKGKQLEEDARVRKAPTKQLEFDLEHVKETFMEVKKSFAEASASGSHNKPPDTNAPIEVDPSVLTTFLETCMKLLRHSKVIKGL